MSEARGPQAGLDAPLQANLAAGLPVFLAVQDVQSGAVLEETAQTLQRVMDDPGSALGLLSKLDELKDSRDLMRQLQLSVASLLAVVGPAQTGAGPIDNPEPISCEPVVADGSGPLIDDFDDGNAAVSPNEGRNGAWSVTQDGSGGILSMSNPPLPELGGGDGGPRAMHLSGSGFSQWGAGLSLELRDHGTTYDASTYHGMRILARGAGGPLRLIFTQANLTLGHPCAACTEGNPECGLFYSTEIPLTNNWVEHLVTWASLTHEFQGGTPFGADQLLSIQVEAPAGAPFDFWIDYLAFF
jgi:hypothetical protein